MKRKGCLFVGCAILGIVVVIVAMGVGIFGLVFTLTGPVRDVGDQFFTAVRDGNYAGAYDLSASTMRDSVSQERLTTLLREYDIKPLSWSYSQQSFRNSLGRLEGQLTLTNGDTVSFEFQLLNENGWKITRAVIGDMVVS